MIWQCTQSAREEGACGGAMERSAPQGERERQRDREKEREKGEEGGRRRDKIAWSWRDGSSSVQQPWGPGGQIRMEQGVWTAILVLRVAGF